MDTRLWHTALKESYIVEAKNAAKAADRIVQWLSKTFADLCRKAQLGKRDSLEEASHNTLLENCYIKKISGYFWEALDQCVISKP